MLLKFPKTKLKTQTERCYSQYQCKLNAQRITKQRKNNYNKNYNNKKKKNMRLMSNWANKLICNLNDYKI